jgi:hypothetical protein
MSLTQEASNFFADAFHSFDVSVQISVLHRRSLGTQFSSNYNEIEA